MSTITIDSDLLYNFNVVASDESLRTRLARYLRKLVQERREDPTLMTKEAYFAKLDKAEAQYERGEYYTQSAGETFMDMLNRYRVDQHV